jgi:phosphonoacetaldehyde hydrolase
MKPHINKIKAIVFDWAGTTIDYGCRAPLAVFLELFHKKGIPITVEEASKPMGMLKIDHIRELFKYPRIRAEYIKKHGKEPDENTINEYYKDFEPALFKILPNYTEPLPGVIETIEKLRDQGLKIGSTTGYTREMMAIILPFAEKKGYKPDFMITSTDVKQGRPYPWMMYHNAMNLGVFPMDHILKIGDTVADVSEAKNSGAWAAGIIEGSSLLGFTQEEYEKELKNSNVVQKKKEVIKTYYDNYADYVIKNFKEIPDLVEEINTKLNSGSYPSNRIQPKQPYLLFTPGPITTSIAVKLPMMTDWGSREKDYLDLVQDVRKELIKFAIFDNYSNTNTYNDQEKLLDKYTSVIIQGSGTFGVESCIGSVVPKDGRLLVIINGEYGKRMSKIAKILNINTVELECNETSVPDLKNLEELLSKDKSITHVGYIHSETTTGILNPIEQINKIIKQHGRISIVDAMSSFGAVPINMEKLGIDFLISSSNKNIQGVPGFAYVICKKEALEQCKNNVTKSLSLDLYDQYAYLEKTKGGFRFTSPVHVIRSFSQAMKELKDEGGVNARYNRYTSMQKKLSDGMVKLGFKPNDLKGYQGPIITTFHSPQEKGYEFNKFYLALKDRNCVIYPGKLTKADTFRIGTIGHLEVKDIDYLLEQVKDSIFWK